MTIDAEKVIFASTLNAYKNQGVKTSSVAISGSMASGAILQLSTAVTLTESPVYFTVLANMNDFFNTANRWQVVPSSRATVFATTGFVSTVTGYVGFTVSGSTVTFVVTIWNNSGGVVNLVATTVPFQYVPYTLAN